MKIKKWISPLIISATVIAVVLVCSEAYLDLGRTGFPLILGFIFLTLCFRLIFAAWPIVMGRLKNPGAQQPNKEYTFLDNSDFSNSLLSAVTLPREEATITTVEDLYIPFKTKYDFSRIVIIGIDQHAARFVLTGVNQETALNDISRVCKHAKIRLNLQDIKFSDEIMHININSDFTHLTFCNPTPTGAVPKYPLRLYFTTGDEQARAKTYYTGEVFYLKSGAVGKYTINRWVRRSHIDMDREIYEGKMN